jgi:hypothetical protein
MTRTACPGTRRDTSGLDAETVTAALRDGRIDSLPGNHSPHFAPVIEPTLSTGIQTLVVAARTWFETSPAHHDQPGQDPASHQMP